MVQTKGFYEVKMHGEYVALQGDKRILKPYTACFKLPTLEDGLGPILRYLLPPFLKKQDVNYVRYITHIVDGVSAEGVLLDVTKIPVRFQSREQLKEYVRYYRLPVNVDDYEGLGLLRDHIRLAQEEPERYKVVSEKYKKKREFENDIAKLNEDVLGAPEAPKPVKVKKEKAEGDGILD